MTFTFICWQKGEHGKNTEDLGIISAYGYALTKGFKGTEEEFVEMMAGVKDYYQEAKQLSTSSNAITTKSWTVGGRGIRDGEDEDNARYYANKADESGKSAEQSKLTAEEYKNDIIIVAAVITRLMEEYISDGRVKKFSA